MALAALLASQGALAAEEGVVLERPGPFPVLRLADGRLAAVGDVVVPAEAGLERAAAEAAAGWLGQGPFDLGAAAATADRHGRLRGAPARDGGTLAARLVGGGLAIAAPGTAAAGAALLRLEAEARAAGRGVWARDAGGPHGPHHADAVPAEAAGRFALVEGRIARIARTTNFWYANFGRSLRLDFTVRVPLAAEGAFAAAGVDLAGLARRRVRVRGWVFEDNGPMIEIAQPLWLEILE